MIVIPPSYQCQRLRKQLLAWFARRQRPFPWREDRDAYRIWVSEVMLQQTQAATVVPYFERFMARFPKLPDLAAAGEQDVLRLWEGLGYYARARNLHRAARQIVALHGGRFPRDPEQTALLPGVGRYMVGAVLSQAYGSRLPILEANSQRVLCRLFAVRTDPTRNPTRDELWQLAKEVLPRRRVGDFNQALMELGAVVCTATNAKCAACPLRKECSSARLGIQDEIPVLPKRAASVDVREAAVVVRRENRVLLVQRPVTGRWAGLWEFPHSPLEIGEELASAAIRITKQLTAIRVRLGPELLTVRHAVTHHRITLTCFETTYVSGAFQSNFYTRGEWIERAELADYPVSSPQRRLAAALTAPERQRRLF